jgi:purine-binding chemotaxis protein CheW
LSVADVEETMRPLPIELLPDLPPSVLGVSIVRGVPIPVVDAGYLFAAKATGSAATRFVTIKIGSRRAALSVDSVIGVRDLAATAAHELPPLFQDADDLMQTLGALDADLLVVLRSARIVPESVWEALETGLASR